MFGRIGVLGSAGSSVTVASGDADALAFFTAAGITDTTQKSAVNTLVTDLKAANIWTKMKAIYPFVGGTAAQHRFNLKSPGTTNADFYLTFYGGGTHSANGYLPNGNSYADTFLIPSTSLSQNSTHISYYSRTNTNTGIDMGASLEPADTSFLSLYVRDTNSHYSRLNNVGPEFGVTNSDGLGLHTISRTINISYEYFKNTTKNTAVKASTGLPTRKISIGGLSVNNVWYFGNKETAFNSIGDGLTDSEASNLYTAVQAYQTTLGRNV